MAKRLGTIHRLVIVALLLGSVLPSPAVFANEDPAVLQAGHEVANVEHRQEAPVADEAATRLESGNPLASQVPAISAPAESSQAAPSSAAQTSPAVGNLAEEAAGDYGGGNLAEDDQPAESSEHTGPNLRAPDPKVEHEITESASIEYIADSEMDAGLEDVVEKPVDGGVTTTTTYKVVKAPAVDLGPGVEDALRSDKYMYTDEKLYSVDSSQALPSDKIVINKLFVPVPSTQHLDQGTGVRELVQSDATLLKPTDGVYQGYTLTTEMLDPNNPNIRSIRYQARAMGTSNWEDIDFSRDEDLYKVMLEKTFAYLIEVSSGRHVERLIPLDKQNLITQKDAVRRYHAKNTMTDALYADVKANYQRLELAAEHLKALGKLDERQQGMIDWAKIAYTGMTQRYNYLNGSDNLNVHYEGDIPQSVRDEFEATIKKIPFEYRKNLVYLRVSDKKLPSAAKTNDAIGLAYYATGNIDLLYYTSSYGYPVDQPATAMIATLLHEIAHIIDANAGIFGAVEYAYPATYRDSRSNVLGFRNTQEFEGVFNSAFKDKPDYSEYYTKNIEEAFAEFMGRYAAKKIFNWEYPRYKTVNGSLVWDAQGFTPMDQAEPYFARLYEELFEQPVISKVVVDTVTKVATQVQNGLIKVGTRPDKEYVDVPYETEEQKDDTLEAGKREVLQAGVNGQILKLTTYALANKATGELVSNTTESVVKAMVKEIIRVGTKVGGNETPTDPESSSSQESSSESSEASSMSESTSSESESSSVASSSQAQSESQSSEASQASSMSESTSSESESSSVASSSQSQASESESASSMSESTSSESESSSFFSESKGDQFNSGQADIQSELPELIISEDPASSQLSAEESALALEAKPANGPVDNAQLPNTGATSDAALFAVGLVAMLGGMSLILIKKKENA
ncbi:G5 domain-containing protein [Abiotrophia defectiva]